MISLQRLLSAFENREQIAKLIIETPKQLSATTQGQYSPQILWEQFDTYMIESVTKNLQVEYEAA